jgi:hypothetical protein
MRIDSDEDEDDVNEIQNSNLGLRILLSDSYILFVLRFRSRHQGLLLIMRMFRF